MGSGHKFRLFVEQELGHVAHFVIYAILEWTLIALLFLDGLLALVSIEFADFFDLRAPCVLCTRIDHILTRKRARCNYNDAICEGHKKDISSLAYCHVHRKLSDIRKMCDGCLLSFATHNKFDYGTLNSDFEGLFDEETRDRLKNPLLGNDDGEMIANESGMNNGIGNEEDMVCSCCGEPMKGKGKSSSGGNQKGNVTGSNTPFLSSVPSRLSQGPISSPRAAFVSWKPEEGKSTLQLANMKTASFKRSSSLISNPPEEDYDSPVNVVIPAKEEAKAPSAAHTSTESEDLLEELRTPSFLKGNRFFGVALSDSAAASPRWANRMPRRSLLDRVELGSDPVEAIAGNETDTEAILSRLKKQVRQDRKSLVALYMELDEERSASAVAANNAMAMITRLQAEKAAVQMEALQYQRMMDEQAEYDQEAIQMLREMLAKREDEIKDLESELDLYRDRYGLTSEEVRRGDPLEKSQSFNSFAEKSDHGSPLFSIGATDTEMDLNDHISDKCTGSSDEDGEIDRDDINDDRMGDHGGGSLIGFERERSYLFGQLRRLESRILHHPADSVADIISDAEQADEKEDIILKEVAELGAKLRALEEDSRFFKRAIHALRKDRGQGSKLLTEIAQNLQKLRNLDNLPVEPAIAVA